jgi:lipopolysaccharide/colanic/teichoic acid biosynthesis glycosyltransferase
MKYSVGLKQIFDVGVCFIALPFLLPLILIIAIIIKLNSPGPVFYRGWRTGLGGRPFRIFKFRTMVPNAERLGGGTTALNDPRITRVGMFLRKYKLDEVPQNFNVIKGDMSLVGPRPELPEYTFKYRGEEKIILEVRPGITDYSSIVFTSLDEHVGPKNADEVFEKNILRVKNQLRIKYVKEQSFGTDLLIILRTFAKILCKVRGSKGA